MSAVWFPLDDACDAVHERFLAALRAHAHGWPASMDPARSGAFLIDGVLTTYVDVAGEDSSLRAEFDGSGVYAHRDEGAASGLGAAGSPDACAAEAARWYLDQLRRSLR